MNQFDVNFLCKRYIMNIPNQIQYEKFLDDIDIHSRTSFSHVGNFKQICDYLRKATLVLKSTPEEHFRKLNRTDLL